MDGVPHISRRGAVAGIALSAWLGRLGAQIPGGKGDLIVLLPGIMGSVLEHQGKEVWSTSGGTLGKILLSLGSNLGVLKMPGAGQPNPVRATRIINDLHLIPGFWKIDGYEGIIQAITALPGVAQGRNFISFPYDWRQDNRVTARQLQQVVMARLKAWRAESGNPDAKVFLVAHSMGGLVSRYFIECLGGWSITRRLVTFGTPYQGSVKALLYLAGQPEYARLEKLQTLVRSFPSAYQLLPTYPCIEVGGQERTVHEVKPKGMDAELLAQARVFHREIASAVAANARKAAYKAANCQLHPVVGVAQETLQWARLNNGRLLFLPAHPRSAISGDGTVPARSAVPEDLFGMEKEFYLVGNHGAIQNSGTGILQVTEFVRNQTENWNLFRSRAGADLPLSSVSVVDVVEPGKPVSVNLRYDPQHFGDEIDIAIESRGTAVLRTTVKGNKGQATAQLKNPGAGNFSVRVEFMKKSLDLTVVREAFCVLPS
jgi:pimeloyl-ACP methyl ester carboxylesterase